MIVGGSIAGGGMYYLYTTKHILPTAIDDIGISDTNPFTQTEQQQAMNIRPVRINISQSIVSQKYNDLMQNVVNAGNNIAKNNNEVIYPIMLNLKSRTRTADWQAVFDTILDAREAIRANLQLVATMRDSTYELRTENISTTKDAGVSQKTQVFAQAALDNAAAYESYLATLTKFVSGSVPTKELAAELNQKIAALFPAQRDFQAKTNALFAAIDELSQ